MKKLLAMLLVLVMVFTLAACNEEGGAGNKDGKTITLTWWFGGGSGPQAGEKEVEKAFNELLHTYPGMENVNIDFVDNPRKEYANNLSLAQSSGEQIDIVSNYNVGFADQVSIGTYRALDSYVEASEGLKDLPDWIWELCKGSDGNIYQIPHYQRPTSMTYMLIPKVWADKYADLNAYQKALYDHDLDAIADWQVDFLKAVREGEGIDTKYLMPMGYDIQTTLSFGNQRDKITGNFVVENNSGTVENLFMTADMIKAYQISAEWYEADYVHPDVLTYNFDDAIRENMMNPVSYVISFNNGSYNAEETAKMYSAAFEYEVVALPCHEDFYIGYTWAAGGTGVTQQCEYPEQAFRLIELMNTEEGKALYNLMYLGIEGVHYRKTGENTAELLTPSKDKAWEQKNFIIGNTLLGYQLPTDSANEAEIIAQIEKSEPVNSELSGFMPDLSKIETQLDQIAAVEKEYKATLYLGAMGEDWRDLYDDFSAKMLNAGLNEVLAELQSQVDDFLAAKKAAK